MHCLICNKPEQEAELHDGIYENKIGKICAQCAEDEKIPLLKKPTLEQLRVADKRFSVRERMERLSNNSQMNPTELSSDQLSAHNNLNKLRVLPKKQFNDKLYSNYYWRLNMGRRRKKLSTLQLSKLSGVSEEIIQSIEKGVLPANFEEPVTKLEMALNINLLKNHDTRILFTHSDKNKEDEILKQVGEKIGVTPKFKSESYEDDFDVEEVDINSEPSEQYNQVEQAEKTEKLSQLSKGSLDLSKRENLQTITINDLQEIKKQKEEKEMEEKIAQEEKELLGEDLDIDSK